MVLTPIDGRMTTLRTVRVHAINLILCLRFSQVRVMNSGLILKLRVDCEGHGLNPFRLLKVTADPDPFQLPCATNHTVHYFNHGTPYDEAGGPVEVAIADDFGSPNSAGGTTITAPRAMSGGASVEGWTITHGCPCVKMA